MTNRNLLRILKISRIEKFDKIKTNTLVENAKRSIERFSKNIKGDFLSAIRKFFKKTHIQFSKCKKPFHNPRVYYEGGHHTKNDL